MTPSNQQTSGRFLRTAVHAGLCIAISVPTLALAQGSTVRVVSGSIIAQDHIGGGVSGKDNNCRPGGMSFIPCATIKHALAVSNLGDTIRLTDGPITECNVVINKDITVRGEGPTRFVIDAGHSCRHFDIGVNLPADVTLVNLSLVNGDEVNGGSLRIDADSSATLVGSELKNNHADSGGAISNEGRLRLMDSPLQGNTAMTSGGAISNTGTAFINAGSDLEDNHAQSGGAISNSGTLTINGVLLASNEATSVGGAIANSNELTINDVVLDSNNTNGAGGAIESTGGTIDIANSTLSDNQAFILGGAVSTSNTAITITDSLLSGNQVTGGSGGALANTEGSVLSLRRSTVSWNEAILGAGGGLINTQANTLASVYQSTFSDNMASTSGGAIANTNQGTLSIVDSSYTANNAGSRGGALFDETSALTMTTVERSTFSENSALDGGALYVRGAPGSQMLLLNSTLSSNDAERGAALFNTGDGDVQMANSTLSGQVVQRQSEGALWTDSSLPFTVNNSIIHNTLTLSTGGTQSASDCAGGGALNGTRNLSDNCVIGGINQGPVTRLSNTLEDNGGFTQTHRLLAGSNAIDQGFNDCPHPISNAPLLEDQRQVTRPQDGDSDGVSKCDIGAYERD